MTILTHPLKATPTDGLETETSTEQRDVEDTIRELIEEVVEDKSGPRLTLNRTAHVNYLTKNLRPWEAGYIVLDASKPWLLYWNLHAFGLLDFELPSKDARRVISTLVHCRPSLGKPLGGFGGGNGQIPHLATNYAAVMTLAYVGDEKCWAPGAGMIDRRAVYDWLLSLKQPDGSFTMHIGGEVDVRASYCALTVATFLNILTPELMHGAAGFIASCQTYEGGLAAASFPYHGSAYRPPFGEAHGGYAFCALAAYFCLLPDLEHPSSEPRLDTSDLLRWFANMQANPIEGGGFRGRTNKLVDGCYSWWSGGIGALLQNTMNFDAKRSTFARDHNGSQTVDDDGSEPTSLYDRDALQEYVLIAAQDPKGGLRDKPGRHPDAYHTCYNLSGLSAAQHVLIHSATEAQRLESDFIPIALDHSFDIIKGANESTEQAQQRMARTYAHAMAWREDTVLKCIVGQSDNELMPTHPVFNVTLDRAQRMLDFFYQQPSAIPPAEK